MTMVTIIDDWGTAERIRLPTAAEYEADACHQREQWTGIVITGIWTGPRSGRRFGRSHSIWENPHTHGIYGTQYQELDESTYLHWCHLVGIEPTNVEPTEV